MSVDNDAVLCARLVTLRDDLRQRLANIHVLDAGLLHLLASVEVALAALGHDPVAAS